MHPAAVHDIELIALARAGDPDALGVLYHEHGGAVLRVAHRLLGSREDAEDVLHDVFLALPEALAAYEERGQFGAWIRRMTVRTSLMRIRKSKTLETIREDTQPAEGLDPERSALSRLDLERAVDRLPEALRLVFVLKVIEGHSHAEVASMLDISPPASEMRLTRALRSLRPLLERL